MSKQLELARQFRQLNQQGRFLLANAWDVASARIFAEAGFSALGTTSGGIAYSHGYQDAQRIARATMMDSIAAIAAAVNMPVSADIEAGYGAAPQQVADAVAAAIAAGAVGINLEDNAHGLTAEPLFVLKAQVERIAAARQAAEQAGIPLWINARTDTFLLGLGEDSAERCAMTVARANAYLAAGADMVFIPCLIDLGQIRALTDAIHGPINLMAMPGAPSADQLFAAGAQRVSLGVGPMLAVMGALREVALEARRSGTWQAMQRSFYGFAEAEQLFAES